MKVLGVEEALEPHNDESDIFSKWCNVLFDQTLFFKFTI